MLIFGIGFYVHYHIGAYISFFIVIDRIAVNSGGFPLCTGLFSVSVGQHSDFIGHHESAVKADAELADDIEIRSFVLLVFSEVVFELKGTAARDDAEIALHLCFVHSDAVIGHGHGTSILVDSDPYPEVISAQTHVLVCQGEVAQFVYSIRSI